MPPYRAVLAVDVEKYSRTPSAQQRLLSNSVHEALQTAFVNCGMGEIWSEASFPQSTGDGYLVGVPTEQMPRLIHPLLTELQNVVDAMQPRFRQENPHLALRLRAAIGVGSLPDTGGVERGDGIGAAMNETHRVLDSSVLKQALADSHPQITYVAAGLTARVYEDAVLGDYTGLHPDSFEVVTVDLPEKGVRADAYLFIPTPSRKPGLPQTPSGKQNSQRNGQEEQAASSDAVGAVADSSGRTQAGRDTNQFGTVQGDVRIGDDTTNLGDGSIGSIGGNTGSIVLGANGPVNTGGRQDNRQDNRRWYGGERPGSRRSRDDRGAESEEDGWDGWDG